MEDKVFFKYEPNFRAYRMYYAEDVEIEIWGRKFKKKKGKGPLVDDYMSFNAGDICIIDDDVFIPAKVRIGNNVVICSGTKFFIENHPAEINIKDSVVENTEIHAGDSVEIMSSEVSDTYITNSSIYNSKVKRAKISDSDILHSKVIESDLGQSKINDSVVEGTFENRISIKNIGFSDSEIMCNFPNNTDKILKVFKNAKIESMFDACFIGTRFFYRKEVEGALYPQYEYGLTSGAKTRSVTVSSLTIGKKSTGLRQLPNSMLSQFICDHFEEFLDNKIGIFFNNVDKKQYADWLTIYPYLVIDYVLDIVVSEHYDIDIVEQIESKIFAGLGINIMKKTLFGKVSFVDETTCNMIGKHLGTNGFLQKVKTELPNAVFVDAFVKEN